MIIKKASGLGSIPTVFAISSMITCPVFAQGGSQARMLDEIIVTAQRRAQNLNDVPVAVQAFSEEMLVETGVVDPTGLLTITPNLNITTHLMGITPYIRGVGNPIGATIAESSVALYVDGSYIKSANASAFEYNNIERIEVLKGPQGTLFGRNATGGLIQVITKDPDQETSVKGKVAYGNFETARASLYATTGITDSLAADIAITYKDQNKGWGTNLTRNEDIDLGRSGSVRTKWKLDVSDETQVTFTADYTDRDDSFGTYNRPFPGTVAVLGFTGPEDFYDSIDHAPGSDWVTDYGAALTVEHGFDNMNFKSISTYRYTESGSHFDQVTSPVQLVEIKIDDQESENFSQELQLYGETDKIDWILGAFYFTDNAGFNSLSLSGPFIQQGYGVPVAEISGPMETESISVYGEITYSLTDTTRLTLGGRWTKDERDIEHSFGTGGVVLARYPQSAEWEEPTYRVVLDHDLSKDVFLYASYSRGFKSGNFNSSGVGTPAFDPEILDSYEVGSKITLADGQAQLNMAAFYYDYQDLQTTRVVAGSLVTVNAASAELYGLEFDLVANITDRLQLIAGAGWISNEYDKFPDAPRYDPNPNPPFGNVLSVFDASGQKIGRVPEFSGNIGGNYLIGNVGEGELKLNLNYYYNDGFAWEPSNRMWQESYSLLHAALAWRNGDESLGVRLYGDNLLDEEYSNYTSEQSVGDIFQPAAPRTFGVEFSFSF